MTVLEINNISKNYKKIKALNDVSFAVPAGSVFGILGPNGSGKTTLLGIIMDVIKANAGSFNWFEKTPNSNHRKRIGTLLETPNFYHYLSASENLAITASIKGRGKEDIDNVLEIVGLASRKNSPFSAYSLGMKQRLAIAAALLGNPEVLVLDEPTNGLDPIGIAEIRSLIINLANQGKTIIMASHMLDEVEKVCTHVAILKYGNLITQGSVNEILINEDIVQLSSANNEALKKLLSDFPGCKAIVEVDQLIQLNFNSGTADLEKINQYCFNNGITLNHLQLKKKSLESKFLELTN
jgi:ABC-2 type transport system ATP-binding protein